MATLYFLIQGNYYNRTPIPPKSTVSEYDGAVVEVFTQYNFEYRDGVNTELISANTIGADYVLVCDGSDEVTSRWFIIQQAKICQGSNAGLYRVGLRRDLIADYHSTVLYSPSFIEKGYVADTNTLIFNNENMTYNQIKKGEIALENNLKTPWIVAYLSRYHTAEDTKKQEYNTYTGSFVNEVTNPKADYELNSLSEYKYYYWSQKNYKYTDRVAFCANYLRRYEDKADQEVQYRIGYGGVQQNVYQSKITNPNLPFSYSEVDNKEAPVMYQNLMELYNFNTYDANGLPLNKDTELGNTDGYEILKAEDGKIIKVGSAYFRIALLEDRMTTDKPYTRIGVQSNIYDNLVDYLYTDNGMDIIDKTPYIQILNSFSLPIALITFQLIGTEELFYDITYKGTVTEDAVYEIIAAPLNDITFTTEPEGAKVKSIGSLNLQWFQDIINTYNGAGWAYDIQLVPYIGIDSLDISNYQKIYLQTKDKVNRSIGIKLPSASFRLQNKVSLPIRSNKKIGNEVDMFRFVSPNGIGEWEFNPYKNNNTDSLVWEADVTLIPFNPYIHVHPIFDGLYGANQEDFRGLICSGDFSLPILNDKWSTYALNNKYYQQIFDRDIKSQELKNNWSIGTDIAGGVMDIIGSTVKGARGGVIGAAASGIGTAAAASIDLMADVTLRNDELSRKKDQFGYTLGTIKAQANTLTRTTSYNINNKYFPYIEYYTCSDEELAAIENKIRYEGMTINVIGKVADYIGDDTTFIKGSFVQLPRYGYDNEGKLAFYFGNDFHIASELNKELKSGIYLTKEMMK